MGELVPEYQREIPAWELEPDVEKFEAHGLPCFAARADLGHWCGYVGVDDRHPLFGMDMFAQQVRRLICHGCVTWAAPIEHASTGPNKLWWFGFDCAHIGDYVPGQKFIVDALVAEYGAELATPPGMYVYRNLEFVREQCILLAKQLDELPRTKGLLSWRPRWLVRLLAAIGTMIRSR